MKQAFLKEMTFIWKISSWSVKLRKWARAVPAPGLCQSPAKAEGRRVGAPRTGPGPRGTAAQIGLQGLTPLSVSPQIQSLSARPRPCGVGGDE